MGDWKSQAPAALAVPSSVDVADHLSSDGRGTKSVPSSPFSTGGVQSFPILTPESLLTPRDPGFLDGASSQARFGLDIGGTLCKVVYFEPEVNSAEAPSRTAAKQKPKSGGCAGDGVANGKTGKDGGAKAGEMGDRGDVNGDRQPRGGRPADPLKTSNGCAGNGVDREDSTVRLTDGNARELMTVSVDHLTLANAAVATRLIPTSPKGHGGADGNDRVERLCRTEIGKENNGNGRTAESASAESCQYSDEKPAEEVFDDRRKNGNSGRDGEGGEDDPDSFKQVKKIWLSSHEPVHLPGRGTLYFKCFETWQMQEFLNLTKEYDLMNRGRAIGATGGGARKFGKQFLEIAGIQLQRDDELKSLVRGIDFLARHAQQESFEYLTGSYQGGSIQRPWQSPENSDDGSDVSSQEDFLVVPCGDESVLGVSPSSTAAPTGEVAAPERGQNPQQASSATLQGPVLARLESGCWRGTNEPLYPYLVVNIGSGVSMLLVHSPEKIERVGGTSLGGSTFLGLANALTGCQSFEEAISLATQGDSTHVDMLVGDIYGGDYTEMNLAATTVASSFGKLVLPTRSAESQGPQHLAKAALLMVTNNIGSIAMLHARNAGVHSIMFTGSFLHNNKLAMKLLAVALDFWSKGKKKAVFLRHAGHAGAMGALLSALEASNPLDALLLT